MGYYKLPEPNNKYNYQCSIITTDNKQTIMARRAIPIIPFQWV